MTTQYFGKNYTISDHLEKISEKKVRKLKKYFSDNAEIKFTVTLDKSSYKSEIVVTDGMKTVRAEAISDNPYKNLDIAVPKIEGQMRKKKSLLDKFRRTTGDKPVKKETVQVASDIEPEKPEF